MNKEALNRRQLTELHRFFALFDGEASGTVHLSHTVKGHVSSAARILDSLILDTNLTDFLEKRMEEIGGYEDLFRWTFLTLNKSYPSGGLELADDRVAPMLRAVIHRPS